MVKCVAHTNKLRPMRNAFELYPSNDYESMYSRADGADISLDDVQSYLDRLKQNNDNTGNDSISLSSESQLKSLIRDAIRESHEDNIVFTLFNRDFTASDVAAINMTLNVLALVLAVITLIKRK